MSRKTTNRYQEREDESDTERSLFARIVEDVIVFVICCFLVKLGVSYLVSVKIPLIVISAILATVVIIIRVCKWRNHDDY